jgi:hypothetical protein
MAFKTNVGFKKRVCVFLMNFFNFMFEGVVAALAAKPRGEIREEF